MFAKLPFHRPVTMVKGQTDEVPCWPQLPKGPPPPPGPTGRLEISWSLLDNQVHAAGASRLSHSPVLPWKSSAPAWLAKWIKHPCQHCGPVFANYTMYKHKHNHHLLLAQGKMLALRSAHHKAQKEHQLSKHRMLHTESLKVC